MRIRLLSLFLFCVWINQSHAQIIVDRDFKILRGMQQQGSTPITNNAAQNNNTTTQTKSATPSESTATVTNGNTSSYASTITSPSMYVRNTHYFADFPINQQIPDDMVISNVSWNYSLSQHPMGIEVLLCWNKSEICQDISLFGSGHTNMFNGKDPFETFTIHYRLGGKGAISPPINGGRTQIIVTYTRAQ